MRGRGGSTLNMKGSRTNANNQNNTGVGNRGRQASGHGGNAGGASLGQRAAFESGTAGQGSTFRDRCNSNSNSWNGRDGNTGAATGGSGRFRGNCLYKFAIVDNRSNQGSLRVPKALGQDFPSLHIYVFICSSTGIDFGPQNPF